MELSESKDNPIETQTHPLRGTTLFHDCVMPSPALSGSDCKKLLLCGILPPDPVSSCGVMPFPFLRREIPSAPTQLMRDPCCSGQVIHRDRSSPSARPTSAQAFGQPLRGQFTLCFPTASHRPAVLCFPTERYYSSSSRLPYAFFDVIYRSTGQKERQGVNLINSIDLF